jgi:hypothetical protein
MCCGNQRLAWRNTTPVRPSVSYSPGFTASVKSAPPGSSEAGAKPYNGLV